MKTKILTILAVLTVFFAISCEIPENNPPENENKAAFTKLEADGSANLTTSKLTLTFDKDIDGLILADITLSAGNTGAEKDILTKTAFGKYELSLKSITAGGMVTVSAAKSGYTITGGPKQVEIFYKQGSNNPNNGNGNNNIPTELVAKWYISQAQADAGTATATIEFTADGKLLYLGQDNQLTITVENNVISNYRSGSKIGTVKYSISGTAISFSESTGEQVFSTSMPFYKKGQSPVINDIDVSFTSLTANGSSAELTTKLTLTFDKDITGLAVADITLNAGSTGAVKGALNKTGTGIYDLTVSNITAGGTVSVSVAKSGYVITGGPKNIAVYYKYYTLPLTSVNDVYPYLVGRSGGSGIENPIDLSMQIDLGNANSTSSSSGWGTLLREIGRAEKHVKLDLALCTVHENRFYLSGGGGISLANSSYIVSLVLPNTTASINHTTGGSYSNLVSVSFPASTILYGDIFSGMRSLVSFTLTGTGSLSVIENGKALVAEHSDGQYLVAYPSASGNITMSDITYIASYAFRNCTSLTSVNFPNVTSMGTGTSAFSGCTNLVSVNFPNATYIGESAFSGCTSLTNVSFPNVINTGQYMFYGCTSLTSVNFPNAKNINPYAFSGCTSLTSVNFPNVEWTGVGVFYGCTSLTNVNLPKVREISRDIFRNTGTTALTIILGDTAPVVISTIFSDVPSLKTVTIKVPANATGYGTIPQTYSGTDVNENWGNGFRGGGWANGEFYGGEASSINTNITLSVVYQE
jgi:hypothetical protein